MSSTLQNRDELLEAVKAPKRNKRPSNIALYIAIVFANIVFLTLDTISALTVYWLTHIPLYGFLTFLAGAVPLVMHESLYVRAYASQDQKRLSMIGAGAALLSIVVIGVMAGVINMKGNPADAQTTEIVLISMLILIAALHAILAGAYFYIDDGIKMNQQTEQAIARALNQARQINAGDIILTITENSVAKRKAVSQGERAAAMDEVMRQLSGDDDGDGIPNYRDPDWKRPAPYPAYASETVSPPRSNGHHPEELDPSQRR